MAGFIGPLMRHYLIHLMVGIYYFYSATLYFRRVYDCLKLSHFILIWYNYELIQKCGGAGPEHCANSLFTEPIFIIIVIVVSNFFIIISKQNYHVVFPESLSSIE